MKVIVLHKNSFDLIGGAESTIYNMAKSLKELGHTPIIVARKRTDGTPAEDNNEICAVKRYSGAAVPKMLLPFSPYFEYKNAFQDLKNIILTEKPDAIIVRDNILSYAVSQYYDINKIVYIPLVVIQYYNRGVRMFNSLKGAVTEIIRWFKLCLDSHYQNNVFKRYKNIAVFSQNVKNQAIRAVGDKNNISIVRPGVMDHECYKNPYDYSLHDEFGISHDKKIFLFVGRIVQEKNIRMLVDAFSKMDNDNVVLCLVGGGDDLEFVKAEAKRLGVFDKIIFAGFRRDTERFYHAADFFVLPSYYEAFGNVIPEAFIAGTPVIGFKTEPGKTMTAIDELLENDKLGIICENFSAEALTNAMNQAYALCTSDQYADIRAYCRNHALENFNWNKFVTEILSMTRCK